MVSMMKKRACIIAVIMMCMCAGLSVRSFAETPTSTHLKNVRSSGGNGSLLDPSRFSINHAVSFGMSASQGQSVASQSVYSTMMEYRFSKPLTLNLNFDMPIHSSYGSSFTETGNSGISAMQQSPSEYLSSMPFDVSLTWQPRDNLFMHFSVSQRNASYGYNPAGLPSRFHVTGWNDL